MRYDWWYLRGEDHKDLGVVAPEVLELLSSAGLVERTSESDRTVVLSGGKKSPTPSVIKKKFSGASADVEIEYLNSDNKVRLDCAFVGSNKSLFPQGDARNRSYTSLDEWLTDIHAIKQEGHKLTCLTAPKERVAAVLDYDTDMTYSLPFRHLYATEHGVQPPTVKAWGFDHNPLELLRQVRDHNLREILVAGRADPLNEGVLDAQPDEELESLWKDDSEQVLAAFQAHTALMKKEPGFLKSR